MEYKESQKKNPHRIKKVTFDSFLEEMANAKDVHVFGVVVREYLKIVAKALLNGYIYEFPKGFGELMIVKKQVDEQVLSRRKSVTQPKLGFHYTSLMKSVFFDENGMQLTFAPSLQVRIDNKVKTKERDYRYEC